MAGMPESAKGVINWVLVVGIIAFILLLFSIIFGNLSNNVGFTEQSIGIVNESQDMTTSFTVDQAAGRANPVLSSVTLLNGTDGTTIAATNYTIDGATITKVDVAWADVNASYTLTYDPQGLVDTQAIILNYTESGTNTAAQLPTVGTIIGIVLLIIILLSVLVFVILRLMGITESTKGGNSNASFGDSNGNF